MKLVRGLLFGLIALMVLLGFGGYLISPDVQVERHITINAPAGDVYDVAADMRQFNAWSPWRDLDPDATYEVSMTNDIVGSWFAWKSEKPEIGSGKQTITSLEPNRSVVMRLEFEGQDPADSYFTLTPSPEGTDVVWGFRTDLGANPYLRYFSFFMDRFLGPTYEDGLKRLKEYVENGALYIETDTQ